MAYKSTAKRRLEQEAYLYRRHREMRKEAREIARWLLRWEFTHFVTLTFSDPDAGTVSVGGSSIPGLFLEERLKAWDARINRTLLGRSWRDRTAERTLWVGTLEKPRISPHYHLLMRFPHNDRHDMATTHSLFAEHAEKHWKKLVPSGTVDAKIIHTRIKLAKYILKSFAYDVE